MLRTTYRLVPYTGLGKIACLMGAVLGSPVSLAQDASNNEPQGVVDNRRETVTAESEAWRRSTRSPPPVTMPVKA